MASRQKSRAPRTSSSASSPTSSPEVQVSGTTGPAEGTQSAQDSAILRSSFDTQPYEATSDVEDAAPKATFVGEQIIYKDREGRIAEAAYLRAQQRGFAPGYELEDWLAAEQEIDALLASNSNLDAR
jgi:Protein of unknown function (DUF2934)